MMQNAGYFSRITLMATALLCSAPLHAATPHTKTFSKRPSKQARELLAWNKGNEQRQQQNSKQGAQQVAVNACVQENVVPSYRNAEQSHPYLGIKQILPPYRDLISIASRGDYTDFGHLHYFESSYGDMPCPTDVRLVVAPHAIAHYPTIASALLRGLKMRYRDTGTPGLCAYVRKGDKTTLSAFLQAGFKCDEVHSSGHEDYALIYKYPTKPNISHPLIAQ